MVIRTVYLKSFDYNQPTLIRMPAKQDLHEE